MAILWFLFVSLCWLPIVCRSIILCIIPNTIPKLLFTAACVPTQKYVVSTLILPFNRLHDVANLVTYHDGICSGYQLPLVQPVQCTGAQDLQGPTETIKLIY